MKKLSYFLILFGLVTIISCGDDEEDSMTLGVSGTLNFDGQSYEISSGLLVERSNPAGAELQFTLADGTFSSGTSSSDSQILLSVRAISEGTNELEDGAYAVNTQTGSMYAFVTVSTSGAQNQQSIQAGSINISGSGSTYSLTFNDVGFLGGAELSGSVSGTFQN
ncbi:MAG: hypothetical protein AAF616_12370 [Bacteroidota bacterium]